MGRTVVVDIHKELRLRHRDQMEVSCCSFSGGPGSANRTFVVTALQGPSMGIRDQNHLTSGTPGGPTGYTEGSPNVIVTIGAAPGAYYIAMKASWSWNGEYSGWQFDQGTIVVEDSGQQSTSDNPFLTVYFDPDDVPSPEWQADGGEWHPEGRKVELLPGDHALAFRCADMVNWEPPTPLTYAFAKRDDTTLRFTWAGGLTGRIRAELLPADVPSPEWTVDGWNTALKSGDTVRVAPGNYTVSFRCAEAEPHYDPPDDKPVFVVREGVVDFTATFKPREGGTGVWAIRQETQVVRSLASASGGVQAEVVTTTDRDGKARTETRTVPAIPVANLYERPTVLLPVEHREVHKTLIATDEAAVARLGLRQKQIRVIGIHGDRQHDVMVDHWLMLWSECVEATLTIPLRPAIRAGDLVTFRDVSYRVRRVAHNLSSRETQITGARQPNPQEIAELVQGEKTDVGSVVVGAIRAAGKRLDNVRYGVVVEQVDWRTYEVRLHGRADTVRAILDRSLVQDLMPGNLVLVARVTEVF